MQNAANTQPATPCLRCGRQLSAARSLTAGYGPGCRARIRAAALTEAVTGFTQTQIDKARELIGDKGIVRTGFNGVWRTVSSDGTSYYLTTAAGQCNCYHALRTGRVAHCYHVAAARMVEAA